jgi:hypothetical protein
VRGQGYIGHKDNLEVIVVKGYMVYELVVILFKGLDLHVIRVLSIKF